MTATLNTNGKTVRKSLADQIDRLDQILDGLAEGINETMTTAVRDAVKEAVQIAVAEVLTNAELQKCLRGNRVLDNEPNRPATPSFGQKLTGWLGWVTGAAKDALTAGLKKVGWVGAKVVGVVKKCWTWAANGTLDVSRKVVQCARACWARLVLVASLVNPLRKPALVALGVGALVGLGCYLAGPVVAATISGFSSALLAWVGWMLKHVGRVLSWGAQAPDVMV